MLLRLLLDMRTLKACVRVSADRVVAYWAQCTTKVVRPSGNRHPEEPRDPVAAA